MADSPILYFILDYDVEQRSLHIHEFEREREAAERAYSDFEEHARDTGHEILLVGADSIETIQSTHSQYFATSIGEIVDDFIASIR
jgi:hypothetical protein